MANSSSVHHIRPRSRCSLAEHQEAKHSQYNLFPWKRKMHSSWHELFRNMTLQEIWPVLGRIYEDIFENDRETVEPKWLAVCPLEGTEQEIPHKRIRTERLQAEWFRCFGSMDLVSAKYLMKYMMLFMVFGKDLNDDDFIYDNKCLGEFLENFPEKGDRAWAFEKCFGKAPSQVSLRFVKKRTYRISQRFS